MRWEANIVIEKVKAEDEIAAPAKKDQLQELLFQFFYMETNKNLTLSCSIIVWFVAAACKISSKDLPQIISNSHSLGLKHITANQKHFKSRLLNCLIYIFHKVK